MAYRLAKRAFDLVVAGILLIVAVPVFVAAAVAILLSDGSPVLFSQQRVGRGGVPFTMWKFRTMRVGAEADQEFNSDGSLLIRPDDPRVFPVGGWLRRTSLDELPELWNVLAGSMSLVGPRPEMPIHAEMYSDRHRRRLLVKPGMTGLTQVSGRNSLSWAERLELDVEYVATRSFWLDLRLLVRTVLAIFRSSEVYTPDAPVLVPSSARLGKIRDREPRKGFDAVRWHRLLAAADAGAHVLAMGDNDSGMATAWWHSPWDSEVLGISVARAAAPVIWGDTDAVRMGKEIGAEILRQCGRSGSRLIVVRVPSAVGERGWVRAGFAVADVNIRFRGSAGSLPAGGISCRLANFSDAGVLPAMAPLFTFDHFHADPRVPKASVERLYRSWIENSLAGRADVVLVAEIGGEVAGFLTCMHDEPHELATGMRVGLIELVATLPEHQGRGVAASLLGEVGRWLSERGTEIVDVGTQTANEGAVALYRRSGFEEIVTATTLHAWVDSSD